MSKKFQKSLFIFRRDLRLDDNTGLLKLLDESEAVLPIFIFDNRQINQNKNEYFSAPAFHFLINSLCELDNELQALGSQLFCFAGQAKKILESLIQHDHIQAVFVNKDYTPFSRLRDEEYAEVCKKYGITFEQHQDITLSPIEELRTNNGKLYSVFTPFLKKASAFGATQPKKNNFKNYVFHQPKTKTIRLKKITSDIGPRTIKLQGGRNEAKKILKNSDYLDDYTSKRNFPALNSTSHLSAHHKFGTISIRESYHSAVAKVGPQNQFISELYWRDFYYYIAWHFPEVFGKSFLPWGRYLQWSNNQEHFQAWCEGKTGVPIIDAGMRELNQTGWMHNRVRMIVASYLTKNLLINWLWGEKYFAQQLIDYDPAQNNGGWQWSASVGANPRPLRIFNPYLQAQKYDPQASYIKQWITELKDVDERLLTSGAEINFHELSADYPAPLVSQKMSSQRALFAYKEAKMKWQMLEKK